MSKFLIVGLGNIGAEYAHTRHNIGFDIADELVRKHQSSFTGDRYADIAQIEFKGKQIYVIKPTTYMNLSGKAVRYWMQKLKLQPNQILVLVDDLSIDFGKIRIKAGGSDAGHNGLKSINELLLTQQYPRLRFGLGNNYPKGHQADFVLSLFNPNEQKELPFLIEKSVAAIESFVTRGLEPTMNEFNRK
jgi:PTH1 family peptidyl-tRNA hydrolase